MGVKWGIPVLANRIARSIPPALAYDIGKGTLAGPIVGGLIFGLMPEVLRAFEIKPEVQWVIYGVLMVLVVYFLPDGIVPALRGWWRRRQEERTASRPPAPAATGVAG